MFERRTSEKGCRLHWKSTKQCNSIAAFDVDPNTVYVLIAHAIAKRKQKEDKTRQTSRQATPPHVKKKKKMNRKETKKKKKKKKE